MSNTKNDGPGYVTIAFAQPVDLPSEPGALSWRHDKHGDAGKTDRATSPTIQQGFAIFRPVRPAPEGKPPIRTVRVPLTNVRYLLTEE